MECKYEQDIINMYMCVQIEYGVNEEICLIELEWTVQKGYIWKLERKITIKATFGLRCNFYTKIKPYRSTLLYLESKII